MMDAQNSRLRYGGVAMSLHWLIAALVLVNLSIGLYMADLPRTDTSRFMLFQLHKSFGLTVLTLSIVRLGWRLVNPIPPLPRGLHPLLRLGAHVSHFLLYFLIVAIPLAGWAMVSSSSLGLPTPYFGLFFWPNIPFLANLAPAAKAANLDLFKQTHSLLAFGAIGLVTLHVLAALYHQFIRRDDVLRRMIPGTDVSDPA
jgi:cytochrome b561